ncbi:MAG TPA: condensation domain-containing protein, partial [Opitutaceae bacterium]
RGPSVNVQTACSTSLVAVCMAAQNLLGYRCDVALAGGVSITFPAHRGQHHQEGGILSPDGHCRTFDAQAAGTVLGDGAGVVVLKRLSDALADGDNVLAVIKGTAINNDGSVKIGYTAPSADGQAEAIALAQAEAGIAPDTISYIEAHGTGTPLGDPIEIAGLTKAFGPTRKKQFCAIGSVKSNIGHLDIAAGVAGLIKTVLALQHEAIPPSLHFDKPNPKIDFASSPFVVNHALKPWPRTAAAPRRAGVSSFGIGGTNAHAVLEEAPALEPTSASRKKQLLLLSAKSATALEAATDNLAAHLAGQGSAAVLADVAYTLQVGRKIFPYRRAVVVEDTTDALRVLRAKDAKQLITARSDAAQPKIAFLFPGQGSQSVGMAREIYATEPSFRATVDRCCDWLKPRLGLDLREVMFAPAERAEAAGKLLTETRITQPALFVIEYALAQLWVSWGVKPTAMIGHSLGEYVAATLAGVMTLEDALTLVAERARLMQAQPAGAMIAIRLPEAQVQPLLRNTLALAAVNAPGLCVVSGPFDAVEALERELAASAIPSKRLATSHAFHSAMMEPALKPLADVLRRMKLSAPKLAWVSNVTGKWITPQQATSPEYWTTHLRQTVRFADGVAELVAGGSTVLLEVGPGSTLASLAKQHTATANNAATTVATLGRAKEGASDLGAMLAALGELWVAGVVPNWRDGFYANETRRIVPLPTYPFERKRYYIEPAPGTVSGPVAATQARAVVAEATVAENNNEVASAASADASEVGTVATLRKLFQNLSGYDLAGASADASFYELGFDSLFLTQASRAVSREFGMEVTFRQLREDFVSFATLAAHLDARSGKTDAAPAQPAAVVSKTPAADSKPFPLSDAQREVWFASQMSPGSALAYNESMTLRIAGALDVAALQRALNALVARHESLRIRIAADGATQQIAASAETKLAVTEGQPEAAWQEAQVRQPFTLAGGALFRPALLRVDAHTHLLALVVHHVIADGWSLGLMARELAELYKAELPGKPAALAQPASFSAYLARKDAAPALPAARDYWRNEFKDGAPSFDLPTDRPRKAERDYSGALALRTLTPSTAAALKALCAQRGCTAFAALLAAYSALLHRLTGQDDLVIGVPSAGQVLGGETSLVGHFANLLAIRSTLRDTQTFGDYLAQITAKLNAAMDHSQLPFGEVLKQLNLPRDPSRAPLAPVVFNTTGRQTVLSFGEATGEGVPAPKPFVHFDLNLHFGIAGETVVLGCYFSAELFDRATIERWLGHFETLLAAAATAPDTAVSALPLLSAAERQTMLVEWNSAKLDFSRTATVPDLFEAQVKRTPEAVAVVGEKDRLTYAELDQCAERVAAQLRAAGVQRDERVGLFLRRTPHLLVGILGVLKSGAGYVPLDPAYPADRLAGIVSDAQVKLLVTERALVDARPAGAMTPILVDDTTAPSSAAVPSAALTRPAADSLAYVIYTSGSTGKPKGVQIEHRAVVALIAWA